MHWRLRRGGALIGLAIQLTACSDNRSTISQTIAQCRLDAARLYAGQTALNDQTANYLELCMEAHGFEWKNDDQSCKLSNYQFYAYPGCWRQGSDKR